jgi:hypothetical protein
MAAPNAARRRSAMRRFVLAAFAAALAVPALADEGSGTGRASFYLELAAEQERLRAGRATGAPVALPTEAGPAETFTRSRASERRPVRSRR